MTFSDRCEHGVIWATCPTCKERMVRTIPDAQVEALRVCLTKWGKEAGHSPSSDMVQDVLDAVVPAYENPFSASEETALYGAFGFGYLAGHKAATVCVPPLLDALEQIKTHQTHFGRCCGPTDPLDCEHPCCIARRALSAWTQPEGTTSE